MRSFTSLTVYLAAFVTAASGLKFSSPSSGSTIDPTQPIVISWSVAITDPSIFDLKLSNSDSDLTLATGVVSYAGTYTVPANTIRGSGSDYKLIASGNGITLGQITGLYLGSDSGRTSTIVGMTLVSTRTVVPTAAASASSGEAGDTGSIVPTASIDSVGITTLSGMDSRISTTQTGGSFVTSTTNRASSSSNAATTTTGSTNTASGQKRLAGELVLGAAGVLAGVVALLA